MSARDDAGASLPPACPVSVVMPILNEERHLTEAASMVLGQDYDGPIELVLALGPSSDRTDEVAAALAASDTRVRLVQNPSGRTPDALNAALAASSHPVVVRVDGHAVIPRDYVSTAVETLRRTGADNVGGIMAARGTTAFEQAVAAAMSSRLGVGNARFHTGGGEGPAETVYLGAFRRAALERAGGYDAHFARAQDWELNHRIRESGGLVWFTPRMVVSYRPRGSVRALARQYFHYGRWRRVVARRHSTISARYLAAPTLVTALGVCFVVAPWWPWALLLPAGYGAAIAVGGLLVGQGNPPAARVRVPVALATMHLSWGTGFLTSPAHLRRAPDRAVAEAR
ncbi:MAG TPA: glycosyltransferase family 2 protein [Angustibacter sp.]|nr:glycosyltransferase family 2 protein [Angustibacter sp.]